MPLGNPRVSSGWYIIEKFADVFRHIKVVRLLFADPRVDPAVSLVHDVMPPAGCERQYGHYTCHVFYTN